MDPPRAAVRLTTAIAAAAATLAALTLAVAIVLATAAPSAPGRAAPAVAASPLPAVASVPQAATPADTDSAVDGRVAFWQARVESGGGYSDLLSLADSLLERARATGDLGDLERASLALERAALEAPPDDAGLPLRRGQLAFSLHAFADARAAGELALELDPGNATALALVADAAIESGGYEDAARAYAALAEEGRTPPILSRLARQDWLHGETDAAETLVAEAIAGARVTASAEQVAFYHFQLAEMLRGRNELDGAAAGYEAALAAQPGHVPSLGGLARVREAQGRRDEAIALLETATARLPSPELVAALGDLHALAGDTDAAESRWALVERIAEVGRANGGVYDRQLVLFLADHERRTDAAVRLAEAEIASRTDVYGYDALAWALFRAGRFDEADAASREALRLGTPDGRIVYHAGLIAVAAGRDDDARRLLADAAGRSASLAPLQVVELEAALERLGIAP